ncbi:MAG: ComF family protein [Bifidobacterium tibiigranuli]|uniref:ComF family protein n=1 Tax=Bifidobacterium tibiigranuli TaxID=2172043 RepID=UPI0026F25294|nr:phosphoribosyltransferase family protein [Bifidobacterium tibiigranuli]MCI1673782.1 ComF family protein [Bifidobacterium tibiigranuli]MCI1712031.1 ComF family protein [Bifidobacterium tibiigranuli]MCI1834692.1 ComF family protein [Bifidobacterium tibiigranuli]
MDEGSGGGFVRTAVAARQRITRGMLGAVFNAVLPRGCAGCDMPDMVLCPSCEASFARPRCYALGGVEIGFGYACAAYRGAARQAVLAWKDHGDEECTPMFAQALAALALRVGIRESVRGREILIVPTPSSSRSVRRRGRWHMLPLVRRLARLLRESGVNARVAPVLTMRGVAHKSVEMRGSSQRAGRVGGHIVMRRGADVEGSLVMLVDDIVTTGSTMRQCVGVLGSGGAIVLTALALAQAGESQRNPDRQPAVRRGDGLPVDESCP